MFMMIRLFHFHNHDVSETVDEHHASDCEHHHHEIKRADISWYGIAFGFAIHTLIDGVALAAATGATEPRFQLGRVCCFSRDFFSQAT